MSDNQARRGLQEPIAAHGGLIEAESLDIAAAAVGGHPYMLQLVGDRIRLLLSGMVSPGGRGRLRLAHPAIAPWLLRTLAADPSTVPDALDPAHVLRR